MRMYFIQFWINNTLIMCKSCILTIFDFKKLYYSIFFPMLSGPRDPTLATIGTQEGEG